MKRSTQMMMINCLTLCLTVLPAKSETISGMEVQSCGKDCVMVKTRGPLYRIKACGQLDKAEWKNLNPNEEVAREAATHQAIADSINLWRMSNYGHYLTVAGRNPPKYSTISSAPIDNDE